MTNRIQRIDGSTRGDHWHLEPDDRCFYYGNYTPKKYVDGPLWEHSPTNRLICNLKKRPGEQGQQYKTQAVEQVARRMERLRNLQSYIIVPVPPSKARNHPGYDDRMVRILGRLRAIRPEVQFRELVQQTQTLATFHGESDRLSPEELAQYYQIDPCGMPPPPPDARLIVFDDVLTTGSHFKAMEATLRTMCPDGRIIGLFVARCERPDLEFSDVDFD